MDTTPHNSSGARREKFARRSHARRLILSLIRFTFASLFCFSALGETQRFAPGQIIVKPKARLAEKEFSNRLQKQNAGHREILRRSKVRVVNVPEEKVEATLAALRNDPDIEYAERDYLVHTTFVPNDQHVASGDEWHLGKIQATSAWDMTTGQSNVIVAVIDSGVNAAHPDLAGKILPGYDFAYGTTNTDDQFGHGTAVIGTIVAAGNNGIGVAGVAYNCSVMPIKVMGNTGVALHSTIAQGIEYAVTHGARVINLSLAGESSSATLQDAINFAWSNNIVVIAAAGNSANTTPQYPAACEHVVGVSATTYDDSRATFSSYGNYIMLAAPGDSIWTTQRTTSWPYGAWRGTSFASPVVAGVAALVASANPSLSNGQIVELLKQSADDLGAAGFDTTYGYGRVNAFRAVSMARGQTGASASVSITSPADSAEISLGATLTLAATASASAENSAVTHVEFFANGVSVGSSTTAPFTLQWRPLQSGTYSVAAVAHDSAGQSATSAAVSIRVLNSDTTAPSIYVAPAAEVASPLLLTGTASDDQQVDRVKIQVNGSGDFITANGTTNWSAQINLIPGENVLRVWSVDAAGNVSLVNEVTLNHVVTSPLLLTTNGVGKVTPDLNGKVLEVGKVYTVKAVPGAGQIFAGWEGIDSNSRVLTFTMQTGLKLVAKFVPTPFPPVTGNYAGLAASTNGVAPETSGFFKLKVRKLGAFSGKIILNGKRHGFSGRFNATGETSIAVKRGTNTPCALALRLDLTNGTDQVAGSVSDGNWTSDLNGDRNVFDALANPAKQAGEHSFVLERAEIEKTTAASGLSKIGMTGSTRVRGNLEDGRKFTTGSSLAKNGDCPFYLSLSGGSEVIIGWLNFPANGGAIANGDVVWVKTGTNGFAANLQAASSLTASAK